MKNILIHIIFIFFCLQFSLAKNAKPEKDLELKFQQAMKLFDENKYSDALTIFQQLILQDTSNANLYYHAGICLLKTSTDVKKAIPYFENASKKITLKYINSASQKKAPVFVYYYWGTTYQFLNDCDKAIDKYNMLKTFVNHNSENEFTDVLNDIALQMELCENKSLINSDSLGKVKKNDLKKFNEIEKRKVKIIKSDDCEKNYKLAVQNMNLDDYQAADAYLLGLADREPTNNNINYLIGVCNLKLYNDKSYALKYFDKCSLEIDREYKSLFTEKKAPSSLYYFYGIASQFKNDCEKAIMLFEKYKHEIQDKQTDDIDEVNLRIDLCRNSMIYGGHKIEKKEIIAVKKDTVVKPKSIIVKQPLKDTVHSVSVMNKSEEVVKKNVEAKPVVVSSASKIDVPKKEVNNLPVVKPVIKKKQTPIAETKKVISPVNANVSDTSYVYSIQIASLNNNKTSDYLKTKFNISEKIFVSELNNTFKYSLGEFHSLDDAKKYQIEVKKKFQNIFPSIIKIRNGKVVN